MASKKPSPVRKKAPPRDVTSTPARYMPDMELAFDAVVKKGMRGPGVKAVQEWLTLHRFGLAIDGDFGSATETAVKAFQTAMDTGDGPTVMQYIHQDALMMEGGTIENRTQYEQNHLPADLEFSGRYAEDGGEEGIPGVVVPQARHQHGYAVFLTSWQLKNANRSCCGYRRISGKNWRNGRPPNCAVSMGRLNTFCVRP